MWLSRIDHAAKWSLIDHAAKWSLIKLLTGADIVADRW